MEMKFNLKMFIYIVFGIQILIYLCWCFVVFSFSEPLIETFKTDESRGFYLMLLLSIIAFGAPHYLPFVKKENPIDKN